MSTSSLVRQATHEHVSSPFARLLAARDAPCWRHFLSRKRWRCCDDGPLRDRHLVGYVRLIVLATRPLLIAQGGANAVGTPGTIQRRRGASASIGQSIIGRRHARAGPPAPLPARRSLSARRTPAIQSVPASAAAPMIISGWCAGAGLSTPRAMYSAIAPASQVAAQGTNATGCRVPAAGPSEIPPSPSSSRRAAKRPEHDEHPTHQRRQPAGEPLQVACTRRPVATAPRHRCARARAVRLAPSQSPMRNSACPSGVNTSLPRSTAMSSKEDATVPQVSACPRSIYPGSPSYGSQLGLLRSRPGGRGG